MTSQARLPRSTSSPRSCVACTRQGSEPVKGPSSQHPNTYRAANIRSRPAPAQDDRAGIRANQFTLTDGTIQLVFVTEEPPTKSSAAYRRAGDHLDPSDRQRESRTARYSEDSPPPDVQDFGAERLHGRAAKSSAAGRGPATAAPRSLRSPVSRLASPSCHPPAPREMLRLHTPSFIRIGSQTRIPQPAETSPFSRNSKAKSPPQTDRTRFRRLTPANRPRNREHLFQDFLGCAHRKPRLVSLQPLIFDFGDNVNAAHKIALLCGRSEARSDPGHKASVARVSGVKNPRPTLAAPQSPIQRDILPWPA